MRILVLSINFLVLLYSVAAPADRTGSDRPLSRDAVSTYIEIRTRQLQLGTELRSREIDVDEYTERQRRVLLDHGWDERMYKGTQERILSALEMLYRYGALVERGGQRDRQMSMIVTNDFLSTRQKQRILQTMEKAYASELERIEATRQDWPAIVPHADALDALNPQARDKTYLAS